MFTSDRRFPRGGPARLGRLVVVLDALLAADAAPATSLFLGALAH
ncbi:MAG TPA: hypothetical protein VKV21_13360 [Solirubrobacteraceae bacterium]|nr:hypothetical protein [Solirubrobacteraceae bacterium]